AAVFLCALTSSVCAYCTKIRTKSSKVLSGVGQTLSNRSPRSSARAVMFVICIDARHAKAVLKMQINKSDRNDAAGIARIMQTGWFREVRVKDLDSHAVKALLASRALLVKIKRDLENQIRGLLKTLGLVIGRAKFNVFAVRAEGLIENRPELVAAVRPLLKARKAIEQQVEDLNRKVHKLARRDVQV